MSYDPLVRQVEAELLSMANEAEDWETVTWLASVGECFDGGDFDTEDFGNLRWRLDVLRDRLGVTETRCLRLLCQRVLDGERAQERNGGFCGDLWGNRTPEASDA